MTVISDKDWIQLSNTCYDANLLLRAMDAVDELRVYLSDDTHEPPSNLCIDLLKLHHMAEAVMSRGSRRQVSELFHTALDVEDQILGILDTLQSVHATVSQLTALYPKSLSTPALLED